MRFVSCFLSLLILICFETLTPAQGPPDLDLVLQTGHTLPIESVAFSGDGKYVVTGSHDRMANVPWQFALELLLLSTSRPTRASFAGARL